MLRYFLPIIVSFGSYYAEIWPSWVSPEVGVICCLAPVLAMLFDLLFSDSERFAQFLSGASYALLAGLAFANGAEDLNLFTLSIGLILSIIAILGWFTEWVRKATLFGLPLKDVFVFLLIVISGFLSVINDWHYPIFRLILPISLLPLGLGLLFKLKWTKYFGAGFCLIGAGAMVSEAPVDPNWLTNSIILLMLSAVFLRGSLTPKQPQATSRYDSEGDFDE